MGYKLDIREKEIENRLRKDYFQAYNAEEVLGDIDFAVAVPTDGPRLFEPEYLLWAEAKKSNHHDIQHSFVQLILTIGKARTFDRHLPPAFLGAFDAQKIAFLPYDKILDIFYINDFNWNVTPSDHKTKEFQLVLSKVKEILDLEILLYHFDSDDKELRQFIKKNFVIGKSKLSKVRINKNNFTAIFQKWLNEVKPTIADVNWEVAKKNGILDADFYLADILSEHNVTLKDKLFVLLRKDHYELDRKIDVTGFYDSKRAIFNDKQRAHTQFWNRYDRPPKREYWDSIVARRDLLVPQDIREIKGSFYTPSKWVDLSQQYLAEVFGENWQDEYYIWDCAAGTGNLLANLTNKYHVWASTLDKADVDVMHDRIKTMNDASTNSTGGANLLDDHVFQFDFLNDSFDNLPVKLKAIIDNENERKKLIIYINPPYAEASNVHTKTGNGLNRKGLSESYVKTKYKSGLGRAGNELFAQFFARIVREIPSCHLAVFSTLKILQGPNFLGFRQSYRAKLRRIFLVPANTFDNVNGSFPIGFQIWDTSIKEEFMEITADIYNANSELMGKKNIYAYQKGLFIIDWLRKYYDKDEKQIAYLRFLGTDFQNNNGVFLTLNPSSNDLKQVKGNWVTIHNIIQMCIYFAVRHCIDATWINDRDQFLFPNDGWKMDREFQTDCLIYTLFHGQNRISQKHGKNHWIPFTEEEVGAHDLFSSHFMNNYLTGQCEKYSNNVQSQNIFQEEQHIIISAEAKAVLFSGRELWRYYHLQPNAIPDSSYYDIRLHFQGTKINKQGKTQMNNDSTDEQYNQLNGDLKLKIKALAKKIEPKIYEYGFLKPNYDKFVVKLKQSINSIKNAGIDKNS